MGPTPATCDWVCRGSARKVLTPALRAFASARQSRRGAKTPFFAGANPLWQRVAQQIANARSVRPGCHRLGWADASPCGLRHRGKDSEVVDAACRDLLAVAFSALACGRKPLNLRPHEASQH